MRADAERARAKWLNEAGRAVEAVQAAVGYAWECSIAARKAAAAAKEAGGAEAAAAWNEAMAATKRMPDVCRMRA